MRDVPTVYRSRDLQIYLTSRFLSTVAMQILSVAVGWHIYDISHSTLALGLVGLSQFAPMFLLTLPAGDISDRFDQRKVLTGSLMIECICGALLLALTVAHVESTTPFYFVLMLFGGARAFSGPAAQSLLPFIVPQERLTRAIAWGSSAFQIAVIAGPALGGFLFALGAPAAFGSGAVGFLLSGIGTILLGGRRRGAQQITTSSLERVKEGIRFVRHRPVVLGAISLDLFAVLLGGATALLPVYARDILHVGPLGLGILRSSPAAGAALVALSLGRRPLETGTGTKMFGAVLIFGISTIVFGISTNFLLSVAALFVLGASDMVSVFIRSALIQFATPDAVRGRVSAVNMLFIGASNELGEFESGITAAWFGTVQAVVIGGIGTLLVMVLWMKLFPPLRTVDRLTEVAANAGTMR
ncbi:MAG: MFS transporter [Alphaproteobacteria bacterium]|nr:MFS transporter [Alphaproteobacteria bacterium]MBV9062505.1 MFS transporter [Alphaproteobacteria bacterium]